MPELRELIDIFVRRNGQFLPVYYFDNGGEIEGESLIALLDSISWQNFYSVEGNEYSNGVWLDNGSEARNTSLNSGSNPTLNTDWLNGRSAIQFDGLSSLLVANAVDNQSLLNIKQSIFLVGQYNQATSEEENFLNNGIQNNNNFVMRRVAGRTYPDMNSANNFEVFFKNEDYNGVPFIYIAHSIKNSNDRLLKYLNGGFTVRSAFSSLDTGEAPTLLGENLNGLISSLGVSSSELTDLELKRIVMRTNSYYGIENANDKHITFFGDSLTAGSAQSGGETWPFKLLTTLKSENPSIDYRYVNDALSGVFFSQYSYWDTDIFAFSNNYTINNKVCFIWLGTNDILNSDVDSATLINTMESFVNDRLRAGFKKIILLTIISSSGIDNDPTKLAVKNSYNSSLKAFDFSTLETAYGANVQVCDIDTRTELQDPTNTTYYQVDELHLTDAGMQVVSDYVNSFYDTADALNLPEDTSAPIIESFDLQSDNSYVDLTFSKGLFSDGSALVALDTSMFEIHNVTGGVSISISSVDVIDTIEPVGSDKRLRFNLSLVGMPDGTETFQIRTTAPFYDVFGNMMDIQSLSPVITLNQSSPVIDFGNALRFDGSNDQAQWTGTVFTLPDEYSLIAWFDIDNTYPDNYNDIFEGMLSLNLDTNAGSGTDDWTHVLSINEGTDPVNENQVRFGTGVSGTGIFQARLNIPVDWEGRLLMVGRVRRKEHPSSGGDNAVNLVVKGSGRNGSSDLDLSGAVTIVNSLTINTTTNFIQSGRGAGGSPKGDYLQKALVEEFLSDSEVNTLWNNGLGDADFAASLTNIYEYLFNETTGNTASDGVSSRDLTMTNFPVSDLDKWVTPIWT